MFTECNQITQTNLKTKFPNEKLVPDYNVIIIAVGMPLIC